MDIDELESKFREWHEWRHRPERDVSENALRQGSRICQEFERLLDTEFVNLLGEIRRLRQRLLTAAGDDLCRLSQEEIKALSDGTVKIPPKDEFLSSCERFHAQLAGEAGVLSNCLTLAQLVAENERLMADSDRMREALEFLADEHHWYEAETHDARLGVVTGFSWGMEGQQKAKAALEPSK